MFLGRDQTNFENAHTNEGILAGLPDGEKEGCRPIGKSKDKRMAGWITLDYPKLYSIYEICRQTEKLRKNCPLHLKQKVFIMMIWTTRKNIIKITNLRRHERANLFGL